MRLSPLSAAAMALFLATSAIAQPMTGPWTGFYAGLNAGYGFGDSTAATTGQAAINSSTVADGARPPFVSLQPNGFIGGGQLGHNWQSNAWVFGLEADIQYANVRDDRTAVTTGSAFPGVRNNQFIQQLEYLGTVRGRLGYAWDRSMLYGTGGFAYGGVNNTVNFSGPAPASVAQFTGATKNSKSGYAVGGGFEHAIDDRWSIKTEYLHYDLGNTVVAANVITGSGGVGTGYNVNFDNMGHVVRVGLNFRFN